MNAGRPQPIDSVLIPRKILREIPEEAYPVIVEGDSMEPAIFNGDVIYCVDVKRSWKNIIPEGIQDGDLVLVKVTDNGKFLVKRYSNHMLLSDNPKYPSWLVNGYFQIVGKILRIVKKEV